MAMLTAPDLSSRKQAIKHLNAGYALRSAFVHHGVAPGEVAVAHEVLMLSVITLVDGDVVTLFDGRRRAGRDGAGDEARR